MKITLHPVFKKSYKKRIAPYQQLVKRFEQRVHVFMKNPYHPLLRNHGLYGKKLKLRAFSVGGDMRVVYAEVSKEEVLFLDIGSHSQVY